MSQYSENGVMIDSQALATSFVTCVRSLSARYCLTAWSSAALTCCRVESSGAASSGWELRASPRIRVVQPCTKVLRVTTCAEVPPSEFETLLTRPRNSPTRSATALAINATGSLVSKS